MLRRTSFLLVMVLLLSTGMIQAQPPLPLPTRAGVELIINGDFETDGNTDKIPDDWVSKSTTLTKSDKLKCDKIDAPIAHGGSCAFLFRGNPDGITTKITQNATDFSALVDGVTLQFSAYIDPRSGTPGATFAKAKVKLSNGNKLILKLAIPTATNRAVADYVQVTASVPLVLDGATVTKVNTQLTNRQTSGKFLLDDISLIAQSEAVLTGDFLTDTDGHNSKYFGYALAVDQDVAAIGAPVTGSSTGQVFVYTLSGAEWVQQQILTGDDIAPGSFFGGSIAIGTGFIVVGAPSSTGQNGVAYVFIRTGTNTWQQLQKLISSDGPGGAFGYSVAIDGLNIMVGAPGNNAVYVFTPTGNEWTEKQKLTSLLSNSYSFGRDVDLLGSTALIGAHGDEEGAGAGYIFTYASNTWTEQQQLTANDGLAGDAFGTSVALGNNTAVVGAPGQFNEDVRAAYIFTFNGSTWTQQQKLFPESANNTNQFGNSVAISGNTILVGAPSANENKGAAYTWQYDGSSWQPEYTLTIADGAANDQFGWEVALYGTHALVGTPTDDVEAVGDQGGAWAYTLP